MRINYCRDHNLGAVKNLDSVECILSLRFEKDIFNFCDESENSFAYLVKIIIVSTLWTIK